MTEGDFKKNFFLSLSGALKKSYRTFTKTFLIYPRKMERTHKNNNA